MVVLSPSGPRKGPKKCWKIVFGKVCENMYVGAAVRIGIVDRATTTTTMVGWWTPPS